MNKGSSPKFASNIKQIYANYLTFVSLEIIRKPMISNEKTMYGFLMISGRIKVNWFTQILLILKVKFGDNPEVDNIKLKLLR